jgi:hypothetical protein
MEHQDGRLMHIKEALLERVQETLLRFVRAFDLQQRANVKNLER